MQKIINLPHLAGQIFGVPQYATRQLMDAVKSVIVPRLQAGADVSTMMAIDVDDSQAQDVQPATGIAVVPVHGILVSRRGQINAACQEITSYERIRSQISAALNDPAVAEIVLDINSGGGAVSGCKELADFIYRSRDAKPITAIINFNAFSAAYFIAAACSKITISQTGGAGSIGVIFEHMETSKMEETIGLKFTTIYRGDNKNNGTPHEALSEQATTMLNELVDDAYQVFTSSVAQYRGIDAHAVIDTQAALYYGPAAVAAGLADELADPQDAINAIAASHRPVPKSNSLQLRARVAATQAKL